MADYGNRPDGSKKGRGYFGEIKRPDGAVSTELSVSVEFDGLRAFMGTEPFGQLTQTERRLMSHQLDVMGEYARTLQKRIDIFRPLPVED
jgi:hypothetical protein